MHHEINSRIRTTKVKRRSAGGLLLGRRTEQCLKSNIYGVIAPALTSLVLSAEQPLNSENTAL